MTRSRAEHKRDAIRVYDHCYGGEPFFVRDVAGDILPYTWEEAEQAAQRVPSATLERVDYHEAVAADIARRAQRHVFHRYEPPGLFIATALG